MATLVNIILSYAPFPKKSTSLMFPLFSSIFVENFRENAKKNIFVSALMPTEF
jgi:hypothetical protein